MKTTRFTKTAFRDELVRLRDNLQRIHKFDPKNGWSQVERSPVDRIVAYGRFAQLNELISDLT